jgi:hypothetical protein
MTSANDCERHTQFGIIIQMRKKGLGINLGLIGFVYNDMWKQVLKIAGWDPRIKMDVGGS